MKLPHSNSERWVVMEAETLIGFIKTDNLDTCKCHHLTYNTPRCNYHHPRFYRQGNGGSEIINELLMVTHILGVSLFLNTDWRSVCTCPCSQR